MSVGETIALVVGIIGALLGAFGAATASWNALRVKDIERFKNDLQTQTDKEIERFKSALQIRTHEQQLALTSLQANRARVIDDIYKALVRAEKHLKYLTSIFEIADGPSKEDRARDFIDHYSAFLALLDENRIYLYKETCSKFDKFTEMFHETYVGFQVFVMRERAERGKDYMKEWFSASKAATEKIPALRAILEDELRSILRSRICDVPEH